MKIGNYVALKRGHQDGGKFYFDLKMVKDIHLRGGELEEDGVAAIKFWRHAKKNKRTKLRGMIVGYGSNDPVTKKLYVRVVFKNKVGVYEAYFGQDSLYLIKD